MPIFTVIEDRPIITSLSPSSPSNDQNTELTVTGSHFTSNKDADPTVSLEGVQGNLQQTQAPVDTAIKVIVPGFPSVSLSPGTHLLTSSVSKFGLIWADSEGLPITQGAPFVTGIDFSSGLNSASTDIIISGFNFTGATSANLFAVGLGSYVLTNMVVFSNTEIHATIPLRNPPILAGQYQIKITTPFGVSNDPVFFTVIQGIPLITGINKTNGPNDRNVVIVITGNYFIPGASALLGQSIQLVNVNATDPSTITATIPSGQAVGIYNLVVTTSAGSSNSFAQFEVRVAQIPVISSVVPKFGKRSKKTTFTINGLNFLTSYVQANTVKFIKNDTTILAEEVNIQDNTKIICKIPIRFANGSHLVHAVNEDGESIARIKIKFIGGLLR